MSHEKSNYNQHKFQYARIVERFSNIIRGQFYGHTHYDEFSVLFNNQSEPVSFLIWQLIG